MNVKMGSLNTTLLENGMVVNVHGALFRLRDRRVVRQSEIYGPIGGAFDVGPVVAFKTDFLGPAPETSRKILDRIFSPGWLETWVIQGNRLAHWSVYESDILTMDDCPIPNATPDQR